MSVLQSTVLTPFENLSRDVFSVLLSYLTFRHRFAPLCLLSTATSKLIHISWPRHEKIWFAIGDCGKIRQPSTENLPVIVGTEKNNMCVHGRIGIDFQNCDFCDRCPSRDTWLRYANGHCVHGIYRMDFCDRCRSLHAQRNQSILPYIDHASHIEVHFDEYDDRCPAHQMMIDAVVAAIKRPTLRSMSITETLYGPSSGYEWNARKTHSPMAIIIDSFHHQSNLQSLTLKTIRKTTWPFGKSHTVLPLHEQSRWKSLSTLSHLTAINVTLEFNEMSNQSLDEFFAALPVSVTSLTVRKIWIVVDHVHMMLRNSTFLPYLKSINLNNPPRSRTSPVEAIASTRMTATNQIRPLTHVHLFHVSVNQFPYLFSIKSLQSIDLVHIITITAASNPFQTAPSLPCLEQVNLGLEFDIHVHQQYSIAEWRTYWTHVCDWLARCRNTLKQVQLHSFSPTETGFPVECFYSLGQCHKLEKLRISSTQDHPAVWPTAHEYSLSLPAYCWPSMHTLNLWQMNQLNEESVLYWIKAVPNINSLFIYTDGCIPWLWFERYTPMLTNLSLRYVCHPKASVKKTRINLASLQHLTLFHSRKFNVLAWLFDNREVLAGSPLRSIRLQANSGPAHALYYERLLNSKDYRFLEVAHFDEERRAMFSRRNLFSKNEAKLPDFIFRTNSVDGYDNGKLAFLKALTKLHNEMSMLCRCVVS